MDKINDLCMWKDLYYQYKNKGLKHGISTFDGYENWDETHKLYKCLGCDGYDVDCTGYRSLESIGRKKQR